MTLCTASEFGEVRTADVEKWDQSPVLASSASRMNAASTASLVPVRKFCRRATRARPKQFQAVKKQMTEAAATCAGPTRKESAPEPSSNQACPGCRAGKKDPS